VSANGTLTDATSPRIGHADQRGGEAGGDAMSAEASRGMIDS
jgi:hypothetical protein